MFLFFFYYVLILQNQSRFKAGDSWINQPLSVTSEIYQSLDDGWEVRGVC